MSEQTIETKGNAPSMEQTSDEISLLDYLEIVFKRRKLITKMTAADA